MLGEEYLKIRDTLSELICYSRTLAQRSRTPLLEGESNLEDKLRKPIRIAVCGESGAGKTAFLEKLLNISLSDVNSTSPSISIIRNSGYRVFHKEEGCCVKFYTRELKNLELVEANGLADLSQDQEKSLDFLLDSADFVFWVLPADNPWAVGTWDTIERKNHSLRKKSAIILQQVDQRDSKDVNMLLGHIRDLSEQRLSEVLPHFAVSAVSATGVKECYAFVNDAVNSSLDLRRHLRTVYNQAYALLTRTEEKIDDRSRNLSGDQEYLQSIEAQIDRMSAEKVRGTMLELSDLGGLLHGQIHRVMRYTHLRTGFITSHLALLGSGDTASKVELFMIDRVSEDAELYARAKAQEMRSQCRDKWNEMRPHLENRLSIDVGDFDEKSFDSQEQKFCEEMVKSIRYSLQHLKLRRYLDTLLRPRFRVMRILLQWVLVVAIAAGTLGCVSENPLSMIPLILASLSLLILAGSVVYTRRTGIALGDAFEESMEDAAPALRKAMQEGFLERVRSFYHGYTPMFESMRRHVADAQVDLQPQQKIAGKLYLRMKALEQEI